MRVVTVAPTELEVVRSMAYCLRELGAGRWPKSGRFQHRSSPPAPPLTGLLRE